MSGLSQYGLIKDYFKDSVAFLASVIVLIAGSYYVSAMNIADNMGATSAIIYVVSATSFFLLSLVAFFYVLADARILFKKIRNNFLKALVCLITMLSLIGCIGTVLIAVANVKQAAQMTPIPAELLKPIIVPLPPSD